MNCLFAPLQVNCIRMQIKVFKAQCISDLLLLVFAFPKRHFIPKMSATKKVLVEFMRVCVVCNAYSTMSYVATLLAGVAKLFSFS